MAVVVVGGGFLTIHTLRPCSCITVQATILQDCFRRPHTQTLSWVLITRGGSLWGRALGRPDEVQAHIHSTLLWCLGRWGERGFEEGCYVYIQVIWHTLLAKANSNHSYSYCAGFRRRASLSLCYDVAEYSTGHLTLGLHLYLVWKCIDNNS